MGAELQGHLDEVIGALDEDGLTDDQWAALRAATNSYGTRRFGVACARLGQTLRDIASNARRTPRVPPVDPCACPCSAIHPEDSLGVCGVEASTTRLLPKRTQGGGETNVCGECARAWDAREGAPAEAHG